MTETINLIITKYNYQSLVISLAILLATVAILVLVWLYNRRKIHQLTHQIPASVLKNYLDSIIQNSTALKSSLFRGGGLDLGAGIPSVMPLSDLPRGNVDLGLSQEQLNQKNAEISLLNSRLLTKDSQLRELEQQLESLKMQLTSLARGGDQSGEILALRNQLEIAQARIRELENLLAQSKQSGSDTSALQGQLSVVTKERDQLKEKLLEYEVIEEDLANLKKLQQENEQLKKSLATGATAMVAPTLVPAPTPELPTEPEEDLEAQMAAAINDSAPTPDPAPASDDDLEAQMAAAINESQGTPAPSATSDLDNLMSEVETEQMPLGGGNQKSADELLSEFEKMLG